MSLVNYSINTPEGDLYYWDNDTEQVVKEYLNKNKNTLDPNNKLKQDLGYTNEKILEVLEKLEELFNIEIPDSELLDKILFENLDPTVDEVQNLIDKYWRKK